MSKPDFSHDQQTLTDAGPDAGTETTAVSGPSPDPDSDRDPTPDLDMEPPHAAPNVYEQLMEAWFRQRGVTWQLDPAYQVSGIDMKRSLTNQARSEALHETTVEQYAQDMTAGHELPPLVLYQGPNGGVLIDGIQRTAAAARSGKRTHPAFVIHAERPSVYDLMTIEANAVARHGLRPTEDELYDAGVKMVAHDIPVKVAAARLGISQSKLQTRLNQVSADAAMRTAGVPQGVVDRIPATVRSRMVTNRLTHKGLAALAELVADTGANTNTAVGYAAEVGAARDSDTQVGVVERLRLRAKEQIQKSHGGAVVPGAGKRPRSPIRILSNALDMINELNMTEIATTIGLAELDSMTNEVQAVRNRLGALKSALDARRNDPVRAARG